MNEMIVSLMNVLFHNTEMTAEVQALYDELLDNAQARYEDLKANGLSDEAAVAAVAESLKGLDELVAQYPRREVQEKSAEEVETLAEEQAWIWNAECIETAEICVQGADIAIEPADDEHWHVLVSEDVASRIRIRQENGCLILREVEGEPVRTQSFKMENMTWNSFGDLLRNLGTLVDAVGEGLANSVKPMELTVCVPSCGFEQLKVRTTSGDVSIKDVSVKELDTETISGDVEIWLAEDAAASGMVLRTASGDMEAHASGHELRVSSTSGDVSLDVEAEQVSVSTVSGDIHLEGMVGQLDAHTVSGDIEAVFNAPVPAVTGVRTISGDIELKMPEGVRAVSLDFTTLSGNVSCGTGVVPAGEGVPVICGSTTSGSLHVRVS